MKYSEFVFTPVSVMSGVSNITGNGYWYSQLYKRAGLLSLNGARFTSKTITLLPNKGLMPLEEDGETPTEFFPRCIIANPLKGITLNSVGLSNFGAEFYIKTGKWQQRTKPFSISFMCIGKTRRERMEELRNFIKLLMRFIHQFGAPIVLEINFSCPNTMHDTRELVYEVTEAFDVAHSFGIKVMGKFSVLIQPMRLVEISRHKACVGLVISNTVPWGELPDQIDWMKLFGTLESPLARKLSNNNAKGGLSGPPLLPLTCAWVERARKVGIRNHIVAGGGLFHTRDVDLLKQSGASSVSIGTVVMYRPWNVGPIIRRARQVFHG